MEEFPKGVEPKRVESRRTTARTEPKVEKKREPTTTRATTRTATASDPSAARTKADSLYRAKKFNDASSVLAAAARQADDGEAKDLRRTSDMYAKLGRAYSSGMAPATKATDAYERLQSALNYDGNVGGELKDEIETKLAQVAPRAAIGFMAVKNYTRARNAVITAEKLGSTAEGLSLVREKLESVAADLYSEASKVQSSDPAEAKEKFRTIMSIVDSKSPWYGRAAKAIAKL